jgi:hypothetical protein
MIRRGAIGRGAIGRGAIKQKESLPGKQLNDHSIS